MAALSNAESAKAFKDCGFESHLAHECLSVVRRRSMRRTHHSSRGFLPNRCVVVCDLETSNEEAMARVGPQSQRKKKKKDCYTSQSFFSHNRVQRVHKLLGNYKTYNTRMQIRLCSELNLAK
jgi:hypothetical protein